MKIPNYFYYSQYSLSSFENCPMKFKRRYIDNLKWKGFLNTDNQESIQSGNSFHTCANRYFSGIPMNEGIDGELEERYLKLKEKFPIQKGKVYKPEYKMRMVEASYAVEANIDLLIINEDNTVEIWDWKTGGGHSGQEVLEKRYRNSFQTVLYMFIVYEQAKRLLGIDLKAEDLSMSYWHIDRQVEDVKIVYSDELHQQFRMRIESAINRIDNYDIADFNKEDYFQSCKHCEYNWYCENDVQDTEEEDFTDILNWDDMEEDF